MKGRTVLLKSNSWLEDECNFDEPERRNARDKRRVTMKSGLKEATRKVRRQNKKIDLDKIQEEEDY